MSFIFITEQGTTLKKESEKLILASDETEILTIPVINTDGIVIFGNVQVTSQTISLLAYKGIPLSFLTMDGNLKAIVEPVPQKNLDLRYLQYLANLDESTSLKISKLFIEGKIEGILHFYKNNRRKNGTTGLRTIRKTYKKISASVAAAGSYESLLGYEGSASKEHFTLYSSLFNNEIIFSIRSKRPPKDPANALLSFGYCLLQNYLTGLISVTGLDKYVGFLHKPDYNRPSLVLDFMEIFRAPIVDRFVLNICNIPYFKNSDFSDSDERGFYLKDESRKKFLKLWGEFLFENRQFIWNRFNHYALQVVKIIRNNNID